MRKREAAYGTPDGGKRYVDVSVLKESVLELVEIECRVGFEDGGEVVDVARVHQPVPTSNSSKGIMNTTKLTIDTKNLIDSSNGAFGQSSTLGGRFLKIIIPGNYIVEHLGGEIGGHGGRCEQDALTRASVR